jgi:thiol:disulfide interchange protein DsbG
MLNRRLALTLLSSAAFGLVACSKEEAGGPPKADAGAGAPIDPAQAYDTVSREAKGFSAGALMSAHTVYVLFDPQCPHCSHLWEASLPLHTKLKFVWAPVAIIGAQSLPQGAALMQATNPVEAMTAHERSLLAGQGGMSASASVPAEIEATIKANTGLLDRLGADSVPFIVARHITSGQVLTRAGSMDTAALAAWLGVQP